MDFIRKEDGNAAKATTWVCTAAPGLELPYYQEALDDAIKRGVSIALHLESRSLLVRFPEPLLAINVRVRLESILKKGRAATKCVDTVKVFDFFHAESWGMLAVNMPDLSKSELFDELVEEESSEEEPMQDADSEDDAPEEPAEGEAEEVTQEVAQIPQDIFALAIPLGARRIVVPRLSRALDMETIGEKDLRAAFAVEAPLTPYLNDILFPRSLAHAGRVQAEAKALARVRAEANASALFWVSPTPEFINVYVNPKMALGRRAEYISWKAEKLDLDLYDPEVFMGLFKQIYAGDHKPSRLEAFKEAMTKFNPSFEWKDLDAPTRKRLNRMNLDKESSYCKNCTSVLDRSHTEFCCDHCERQWCPCGVKYSTRMVQDTEKMGLEQEKLGNFGVLVGLAEMLPYKDELAGCRTIHDILAKFDELEARRAADKCCDALSAVVVGQKCQRCLEAYERLSALQAAFMQIASGKVNWGHCHVAAKQLAKLRDINPLMLELFCKPCAEEDATERASKRMRIQ